MSALTIKLLKEKTIQVVNGRCSDCIGIKNAETGTPRAYSWHDCYCKREFSSLDEKAFFNCSLKMIQKDFHTPIKLKINDEIRIYKSTFAKESYLIMDQYSEARVIDIYPAFHMESMKTKMIDIIVEKEVCGHLAYYYTKEKLLREINSLDRYHTAYGTKECLNDDILKEHPEIQVFYPNFHKQEGTYCIDRGLDMKGNHIILLKDQHKEEQLELLI